MVRALACETDGRRFESPAHLKTFNLNFKIQLCPNKNNNKKKKKKNNNNNNSHHLLGLRFAAANDKLSLFYRHNSASAIRNCQIGG